MLKPTTAERPASTDADAYDLETLRQLNDAYIRSVQTSDVGWFEEMLAPDFLNSNPDGSLVDRARLPCADRAAGDDLGPRGRGRAHQDPGRRRDHPRPDDVQDRRRPQGGGRYTDIWARRNGRWLAVAAHVTRG